MEQPLPDVRRGCRFSQALPFQGEASGKALKNFCGSVAHPLCGPFGCGLIPAVIREPSPSRTADSTAEGSSVVLVWVTRQLGRLQEPCARSSARYVAICWAKTPAIAGCSGIRWGRRHRNFDARPRRAQGLVAAERDPGRRFRLRRGPASASMPLQGADQPDEATLTIPSTPSRHSRSSRVLRGRLRQGHRRCRA